MSFRLFIAILVTAAASLQAQVSYDRILNADREPHNWLSYSGTPKNQRYSLLTQITAANVKGLQKACFRASSFPEFAMSSKDAYESLVANEVDYVPLDATIKGRIAATLALIYPPGIGVLVPGERWDDRAQPMLDYFSTFEESFNRFPGFNYEVQGVYQEIVDGRIKFHTYVVRE